MIQQDLFNTSGASRRPITQRTNIGPYRPVEEDEAKRMVELYGKGYGIKFIGDATGRAKQIVKKVLKRIGVYRGNTNGLSTDREYWKQRQAAGHIAAMSVRERIRTERAASRRRIAAQCLRGLRKGVPVEQTCLANEWSVGVAFAALGMSYWYNVVFAKRKIRNGNPKYLWHVATLQTRSRKYRFEEDFSDSLCASVGGEREVQISSTFSRADIVHGKHALECKIRTTNQCMMQGVGQCILYKSVGYTSAVCVPDDVRVTQKVIDAASSVGVSVISEDCAADWIAGRGGSVRVRSSDRHPRDRRGPTEKDNG